MNSENSRRGKEERARKDHRDEKGHLIRVGWMRAVVIELPGTGSLTGLLGGPSASPGMARRLDGDSCSASIERKPGEYGAFESVLDMRRLNLLFAIR